MFPEIKSLAKYKQISSLQRKNIGKNENKTQFSLAKIQLMVYQKE